ncbi:MAG: selenium cofactor biosynthesis protein YqeC [Actinomycetota bacterium]
MQRRHTVDELASALECGDRELVSIVGGGGKTTTLFALGRQLGGRRVLTTTTKMGSERDDGVAVLLDPSDDALGAALDRDPRALVWTDRSGHRADGVAPEACDRWFATGVADHVIVEADGSRRRPFKAPYPYEPVVPDQTTLLVACIGASALGGPIAEVCHRSDAVVDIVGGRIEDTLTPAKAAAVLLSDEGSRKSMPDHARFVIAVHQVRASNEAAVLELVQAVGDRAPIICVGATA